MTANLIKIVGVVLQYGILLFLFLFIYKTIQYMWKDSRKIVSQENAAEDGRGLGRQEAVLTVLEAGDQDMIGRRYAFTGQITIGRGADNDIVLQDTYVSHHHACITLVNNQFVAEDLQSANKTFLNDVPLEGRKYLKKGDKLRIGMALLQFER